MNEHTIVNGIFAVIAIVVFATRVFRSVTQRPPAPAPPANAERAAPNVIPNRVQGFNVIPSGVVGQPQSPRSPLRFDAAQRDIKAPLSPTAAPRGSGRVVPSGVEGRSQRRPSPAALPVVTAAVDALAAFPVLDLTLPDALGPAALPGTRPVRRTRAGGVPGSPGWGPSAIVALEILGPPVALRSGATLGAPHAF